MSQKLAGAGLGKPHEVLDFDVMIEFRLFVRGKGGGFLALDQVPYALASLFGGLELNDLSRTQRGDEFDEFFVRFHFLKISIAPVISEATRIKAADLMKLLALVQTLTPRERFGGQIA
jgi:hypothetical protein